MDKPEIELNDLKNIFYKKTVLITGHTGFKGSWLSIWLKELGATVIGYALEPYTVNDNFVVTGLKNEMIHNIGDIRDFDKLENIFNMYQPEIVFHLAAQPIVRESYNNPKDTFDINIMGTVNVLECCRNSNSVQIIINVTSDKCYKNNEWIWGYRESDPMGGYDPYSSSKGCSELVTSAYRNAFLNPTKYGDHGKFLASVRAGNVIGGGDWQKDRLIPDCIRALENNESIEIRNPNATRPWQHVLEALSGYINLSTKMLDEPDKFSGAWNFGPNYNSVISSSKIADMIINNWGSGKWIDTSSSDEPYETNYLSLDISKARNLLNWKPKWDIERCIEHTVNWYKSYKNHNMFEFCVNQIKLFHELNY